MGLVSFGQLPTQPTCFAHFNLILLFVKKSKVRCKKNSKTKTKESRFGLVFWLCLGIIVSLGLIWFYSFSLVGLVQ